MKAVCGPDRLALVGVRNLRNVLNERVRLYRGGSCPTDEGQGRVKRRSKGEGGSVAVEGGLREGGKGR